MDSTEQQVTSSGSTDTIASPTSTYTPPSPVSDAAASISDAASKLTGLDKLKETAKTPSVPGKQTSAPTPGTGATPGVVPAPYTPDFKYKAAGKEHEIPEKFRGLITDKASEEEVKKLFGQAATLDEVKGEHGQTRQILEKTQQELKPFKDGADTMRKFVQKNDYDNFFKFLNIHPEKIYKWVLDKVQYNQLPPEQRAQIDNERNLREQNEQAQIRASQASQRELQFATQLKEMQLQMTLEKADVKSMTDAFDSRVGKPGAFRQAVIDHAQSVWALSQGQIDLTPEQAVQSFVQKYGNPSAFAAPAASAVAPAASQPNVKVIPNVAGRSTSPVKTSPRSMEDLKRLREAAIKEDNANRSPSQGYLAG